MILTKHVHVSHSCCHVDPSTLIVVLLFRSSNCTHGLRHSQVSNSAILVSADSSCMQEIFYLIRRQNFVLFKLSYHTLWVRRCTALLRNSIVFCIAMNWPQVGHDVSRLGHCTRCPSAPLINRTSCKRPCKHFASCLSDTYRFYFVILKYLKNRMYSFVTLTNVKLWWTDKTCFDWTGGQSARVYKPTVYIQACLGPTQCNGYGMPMVIGQSVRKHFGMNTATSLGYIV